MLTVFRTLLLGGLFLTQTVSAFAGSVPLNSTLMIFSEWDLEACPAQVKKAVSLSNKKLNFVLTQNYRKNLLRSPELYCSRLTTGECVPASTYTIQRFEEKLKTCFREVASAGLDVAILPHLDAAEASVIPRNWIAADPLAKVKGYSYFDILIDPITRAIAATLPVTTKIEFSMQGEMGASVFRAPESYRWIMNAIRERLVGRPVKVGVSFAYSHYNGFYGIHSQHQLNNLAALMAEVDFIGVSAYRSVSVHPRAADFEANINELVSGFKGMGISLSPLKEYHFSEVGIGGGGSRINDGKTLTLDPEFAAKYPYSGLFTSFEPGHNPWSTSAMVELRQQYYRALLEFLSRQTPQYRVRAAFMWNCTSWDPQGLYGADNDYADPVIIDMIRKHNERVSN